MQHVKVVWKSVNFLSHVWCHQNDLPKCKLNTELYIFCCTGRQSFELILCKVFICTQCTTLHRFAQVFFYHVLLLILWMGLLSEFQHFPCLCTGVQNFGCILLLYSDMTDIHRNMICFFLISLWNATDLMSLTLQQWQQHIYESEKGGIGVHFRCTCSKMFKF